MALLGQGRNEEALQLLRDVAALTPANFTAQTNVGNVLVALHRPAEALAAYDAALKLRPDDAPTHVRRGAMLALLGQPEAASESYDTALALDPGNADALNNKGTLLGDQQRYADAIACYERALLVRPNFAEALNNLAVALAAEKRHAEALEKYAAAIQLKPDYVDAIKNRAELLAIVGRNEESLAAYDRIMPLLPARAELHNNRSTVLLALNRHREGLLACEEALRLKPDYPDALSNRGIALAALRRFEDAIASFRAAIALDPGFVNAHWNASLSLLRLGRFEEGWREHEWRWHKPEFAAHIYPFTQPKWLGKEDLRGKTILVTSEQGFGDAIHFCRYVPLLEAKGARVLLFVPEPLVALLQTSFPKAHVFSKAAAFPPFDFHCPVLSLPLAFNTTLENIPAATPYLHAPLQRVDGWRQRLGKKAGHPNSPLRVGIVWAGSASHKNDLNRSIAFESFRAILDVPDVAFFCLQKEIAAADLNALQSCPQVTLLGDALHDFADTTAAIEAMDLVISVDTSVAHLAAALGKPTWILLPYISDWRWRIDESRSAWYPSSRLYWQPDVNQWEATLQQIADDLPRFSPEPQPALGIDEAVRLAQQMHREGRLVDAAAVCAGILQLNPQHFEALQLTGAIHLQQQRVAEGIASFQQALALQPGNVTIMSNLCGALRLANRHEEAYPLYDRAAAIAPRNPSIPTNRAASLLAQKRYDEALASLAIALAIDPHYIAALNNVGVARNEQRRHESALESFDKALAIQPDYADALNNRGLALVGLGRLADAEVNYQRALALSPNSADASNNLGLVLASQNRIDEALACFRKAQSLKPDYVDAFWNESLMNLVIGNYADGWRQYEWRWKKPEFEPHTRRFHLPQWTGKEDINGRTIFLHYEQGFGDAIQFVRFIDMLHARGAKVLLSSPPQLRELLQHSFPEVGVFSGGDVLPPFDFHCPLMSLPLALGTTVDTIPARTPYLHVPPQPLAQWQARLPATHELKVGLVWSGNPKHQNDRVRSLSLDALADLVRTPSCRFYALQKEVNASDAALLDTFGITALGSEFDSFTATAAAIMQLDLVISVDTSVAHLAGALGKPIWLLLAFAPDWRWLLNREDSPWYPTARLFRQPSLGDMTTQVGNLTTALSALVNQR